MADTNNLELGLLEEQPESFSHECIICGKGIKWVPEKCFDSGKIKINGKHF